MQLIYAFFWRILKFNIYENPIFQTCVFAWYVVKIRKAEVCGGGIFAIWRYYSRIGVFHAANEENFV